MSSSHPRREVICCAVSRREEREYSEREEKRQHMQKEKARGEGHAKEGEMIYKKWGKLCMHGRIRRRLGREMKSMHAESIEMEKAEGSKKSFLC